MLGYRNKLTLYSLSVNLLIVALTLGLVLSSGTPQQQIIQNYLNNEELPVISREGRIQSIGIEHNLEDEIQAATGEVISRYEAMFRIHSSISFGNQSVQGDIYYLSSDSWDQLSENGTYDMITFERTEDISFEDLEQVSIDQTESNYTSSAENIADLDSHPEIIYGYFGSFYSQFEDSHVSLLLPMTAYPDKILTTDDTTFFREFFFLQDKHLRNAADFNALESQIIALDQTVTTVWQDIDHSIRDTSYLLLEHLYSEEGDSFEPLFFIMTLSIPKILFIQVLMLYGLHILMRRFFNQFELLYTRGLSISDIRQQTIIYSSILPTIPVVLPLLGYSMFNDIELQMIYSILVPWMVLYLFASIWIIIRQLRQFKEELMANFQPGDGTSFSFHKIFLVISVLYLLRIVLHLLGLKKDYPFASTTAIFVPSDIGFYLSWSATFATFGVILYLFEGVVVKQVISNSLPVKMWFSRILQKRGVVLLFLLILTFNASFDNLSDIDQNTSQAIDDVRGGMGDYWVDFWAGDGITAEELREDVGQITQLQSYLPLYKTFFEEIDPNHGKSSQYGITIVNQTLYDNFTCSTCDTIEQDKFFGDKIWIPGRDYPAFETNKHPFDVTLSNGETITLNPNEFARLDEKSGVIIRGTNTLVVSHSTWLTHDYPTLKELELSPSYLMLSFLDDPTAEEVTSRITTAFGIEAGAIRVGSTTDIRQYNTLSDDLQIVFYLNLVFAFFIGLSLSHLILGDTALQRISSTIRRRYGKYDRLVQFRLLTHGFLLFLSILGYTLAQNITLVGIKDNYWDYEFYKMDWSQNLQIFGLFLLVQAGAQGIYSFLRWFRTDDQ